MILPGVKEDGTPNDIIVTQFAANDGLYGWERWGVGGEVGYAFTPWTDLLIAGSYQDYSTQNRKGRAYEGQGVGYGQSSGSKGMTAQVGLG